MSNRFNVDYILAKLYLFDERLGGDLKEREEEEAKRDPFYVQRNEILEFIKEIKKL